MATSPIATAADYADAMMSARRAKNVLFLLIVLSLVAQIAIFFLLRQKPDLVPTISDPVTAAPSLAATQPATPKLAARVVEYLVVLTGFMGIALSIVLAAVLLLLVTIMLVGRLIGVSRVTSSFIWCLILIVLLFPWQTMLISPTSTPYFGESSDHAEFRVPGVLYTWGEIVQPARGAHFTSSMSTFSYLRWARFVGFPIVAIVITLMVQSKSSRGLRLALGEVEFDVAEGARET
jgi:hypothetical protein